MTRSILEILLVGHNPSYLAVQVPNCTITGTLEVTAMICKLYRSHYLDVYLFNSVRLIPVKVIRPVCIVDILPCLLVEFVLLWPITLP